MKRRSRLSSLRLLPMPRSRPWIRRLHPRRNRNPLLQRWKQSRPRLWTKRRKPHWNPRRLKPLNPSDRLFAKHP